MVTDSLDTRLTHLYKWGLDYLYGVVMMTVSLTYGPHDLPQGSARLRSIHNGRGIPYPCIIVYLFPVLRGVDLFYREARPGLQPVGLFEIRLLDYDSWLLSYQIYT